MKYGLDYIEPFTLLAVRSALNVLFVAAILPFVRVRWPQNWRAVGHIAVAGFLLQLAYLGAMFVALGEGISQGAGRADRRDAAADHRHVGRTVAG